MVGATWNNPNQLQAVQALGAGLVAVNLRKARVAGGVGDDQAVDVGEPEEPANRVHRGVDRGAHQPGLAEVPDAELDVGSITPYTGPLAALPGVS
jgi:hypothetical protein